MGAKESQPQTDGKEGASKSPELAFHDQSTFCACRNSDLLSELKKS